MKNEPTKPISTFPATPWKIWLLGIVLFIALFMVIKGVSMFKEKEPSETVFTFNAVDALPSFPNGEQAFGNYLQKNIHTNTAIKGRVVASFVVNKTGTITNVKILRGLSTEADQEVIRVLENSPNWVPGKKNGQAVNVAYALPVNFDK